MKGVHVLVILLLLVASGCETKEERKARILNEIEILKYEAELAVKQEELRLADEARAQARRQKEQEDKRQADLERERRAKAERLKRQQEEADAKERQRRAESERLQKEAERKRWLNNSLSTGAQPWSSCYGTNKDCSYSGCSQITVKAPMHSDVIATIKQSGKVVRHAYIRGAGRYTFEFPDGTYQAFFYYGKGWNPNKIKQSKACSGLPGGFIENESISKDDPQRLSNNVLTYELILQENGNLQTKPSNESEAF